MPIRTAVMVGAPDANTTKMLAMMAGTKLSATTVRPSSLPTMRTVRSVATTTSGNVNADTAIGLPKKPNLYCTSQLLMAITKV